MHLQSLFSYMKALSIRYSICVLGHIGVLLISFLVGNLEIMFNSSLQTVRKAMYLSYYIIYTASITSSPFAPYIFIHFFSRYVL